MSTLQFRFYPPKKQQDINLVPATTIVGQSALVAKSTVAKKRNSFYGAQPYGESRDRIKTSGGKKAYAIYNTSLALCDSFE